TAVLRESPRPATIADVGVRRRQGRRTDARVRPSHLRSGERLRKGEARGRWSLGVVAGRCRRRARVGQRARALPARVHRYSSSASRFVDLRSPPRSRALDSTYCDRISLSLRAAVGTFTAHPTPMTLSENTRSLSGSQ